MPYDRDQAQNDERTKFHRYKNDQHQQHSTEQQSISHNIGREGGRGGEYSNIRKLQEEERKDVQRSIPTKQPSDGGGYLSSLSSYVQQLSFSDFVRDMRGDGMRRQDQTSHGIENVDDDDDDDIDEDGGGGGALVISSDASRGFLASKDIIVWTHFQSVEYYYHHSPNEHASPKGKATFPSFTKLHLILAYDNGFQVFDVSDPNNVKDLVSLRQQSPVKLAKILPECHPSESAQRHEIHSKHPLIAVVCTEEFETIHNTIKFYSLKEQNYVHKLKLDSEIFQMECRQDLIVVSTRDQILWFNPVTMEKIVHFSCFPNVNMYGVMALGDRWLAYPGNSFVTRGSMDFTAQSISEISMGMAKKAASGLYFLGDLGLKKMSAFMNSQKQQTQEQRDTSNREFSSSEREEQRHRTQQQQDLSDQDMAYAGTVEIRDTKTKQVIAHFKAHNEPIAALAFDKSGTLLVTASIEGSYLNVFQVLPVGSISPVSRSYMSKANREEYGGIRHLYKLYRGITSAIIQNVQFSINSKWISVSSAHGTTHLFAIHPLGGQVTPATHMPPVSSALSPSSPTMEIQEAYDNHGSMLHSFHPRKPITLSVINRIYNALAMVGGGETNPQVAFHSPIATTFYTSALGIPLNTTRKQTMERILISTSTGLLMYYTLEPYVHGPPSQSRDSLAPHHHHRHQNDDVGEYRMDLKVQLVSKWDMCRRRRYGTQSHPLSDTCPNDLEHISNSIDYENLPLDNVRDMEDIKSRWISKVETETYMRPSVPLWMIGQFKFKTFDASSSDERKQQQHDTEEESLYEDVREDENRNSVEQPRQNDDVILPPTTPERDNVLMQSLVIKNTGPIPTNRADPRFFEPSAPLMNEEVARAMDIPIFSHPNDDGDDGDGDDDVNDNEWTTKEREEEEGNKEYDTDDDNDEKDDDIEHIDHYFHSSSPAPSPPPDQPIRQVQLMDPTSPIELTENINEDVNGEPVRTSLLNAWNESYFGQSDGEDEDENHPEAQSDSEEAEEDNDDDNNSELSVQLLIAQKDQLNQQSYGNQLSQTQPIVIHVSPDRKSPYVLPSVVSRSVESETSADEMAQAIYEPDTETLQQNDAKLQFSQAFEMKEDFYKDLDEMEQSFFKSPTIHPPSFSPQQDMLKFEDTLDVSEISISDDDLGDDDDDNDVHIQNDNLGDEYENDDNNDDDCDDEDDESQNDEDDDDDQL